MYRRALQPVLRWYFVGLGLASAACQTPLFRELSPAQTGVTFRNDVHDSDSLHILNYAYFYNGAGVAAGDLNGDGRVDLYFTANRRAGNRLYLNRSTPDAPFRFEDVTAQADVAGTADWHTGVTLADVNADGRLDLYVCAVHGPGGLTGRNALYVNLGNDAAGIPRFREEAERYGLAFRGHATQAAFFDYDHDNDLDCFLLNHSAELRDDYRDAAARLQPDSVSGSRLFENRAGRFIDVTQQAGIYPGAAFGLGLAVGDLTGDGWDDIYVGNDFREHDYCYVANPRTAVPRTEVPRTATVTFTEQGTTLFRHHSRFTMGCAIGDLTNDGQPDVVTLDMLPADERVLKTSLGDDEADTYAYKRSFGFGHQVSRNTLQINLGPGLPFSDRALLAGMAATDWSWSPLLADFTNDGWKDLLITNGIQRRTNDLDFARYVHRPGLERPGVERQYATGRNLTDLIRQMPDGRVPDFFFAGSPSGRFLDHSAEAGFDRPTLSNGATYADLDNDGDLDLIVNRVNEPAGLYENRSPSRNYLTINLLGPAGNPFGIGARLDVYERHRRQQVHQSLTRGFLSAVPPVLHVGLDTTAVLDSVTIRWPDGHRQTLRNIRANQSLTLRYADAPADSSRPVLPPALFTELTQAVGLTWTHRENTFNDFAQQPLIPHKLSTAGPPLAVADVNGDGLNDIYAGGAAGQPGALLVQEPTGRFRPTNEPVWAADAASEDVAALFFDADTDGDPDLYVASGGNEWFGTDDRLRDRLYLNSNGRFARSADFPALFENKSCVRAADVDRDGDLDLFVGGRANARQYGATPSSVLLRNDKGRFTIRTDELAPGLSYVGLVTDARWSDVNRDGWPDLLVVGDWLAPTLFLNRRGQLDKQPTTLPTGWWTCLLAVDADHDGDDDFLAGNWGLNSKLSPPGNKPGEPVLHLYLADPDGNGELDPLLAINRGGTFYPFLGNDKLEQRLPVLKKRFTTYRASAGLSLAALFGDALANARRLTAQTLASCLLRNENGTLRAEPLPDALQAAPIFTIAPLPNGRYVAAGNFSDVLPFEGRYDALSPTTFSLSAAAPTDWEHWPLSGDVRAAVPLRLASGKTAVLLAVNNGALRLVIP